MAASWIACPANSRDVLMVIPQEPAEPFATSHNAFPACLRDPLAIDAPQAAPTLMLFDTQGEVEMAMAALIARGQRHVYVLPPVGAWGNRPTVNT